MTELRAIWELRMAVYSLLCCVDEDAHVLFKKRADDARELLVTTTEQFQIGLKEIQQWEDERRKERDEKASRPTTSK